MNRHSVQQTGCAGLQARLLGVEVEGPTRVQPVSRAQFDNDFLAILTPAQQRTFRESRIRFIIQTRLSRS